eukprot:4831075-Pyramimonas_sp.AAC.1
MVDGMLIILLDMGSNSNFIGLRTAQTFERVSRSHGHDIKQLDLTKRRYVSGVGHRAAACDKSMHCNIACKERGGSAGAPAIVRLDTYSANVADGSGGNVPAILRLCSMSNTRATLILEQGHENDDHPRALDLIKTPSGHPAIKVDEYGVCLLYTSDAADDTPC